LTAYAQADIIRPSPIGSRFILRGKESADAA